MKNTSHSRLLLLELVFNLIVFAVCALICIALLIHSRKISVQSTDLTQAVYLAQTAAEVWKTGGTPNLQADDYTIALTNIQDNGPVRSCTISVTRKGTVLYTLEEVCSA